MKKRYALFLALFLLLVLKSFTNTTHLQANPGFGGRLTALTPFDLKIISSGFYQLAHNQSLYRKQFVSQSIEDIFYQASQIRYKKDIKDDQWQNPQVTWQNMEGDCEDIALWLFWQLKRHGHQDVRIAVGKYLESDSEFHTWAMAWHPTEGILIIDPIFLNKVWKKKDLPTVSYNPLYSYDEHHRYKH